MKNSIIFGLLIIVLTVSCQKDVAVNGPLDDQTVYNGVYMIFFGNPDMYLVGSGYNVNWTFRYESFICEVQSNDRDEPICRIQGHYKFNDSLEFTDVIYSDPICENEFGLVGKFAYIDGFKNGLPDTLAFWQIVKVNDSTIKKEVHLYKQ